MCKIMHFRLQIFQLLGEPDEAFDGPDSGYDIIVDDEAVVSQYGHERPQIHQVQHIHNIETLQQFSPAYPVQPIYRPVVYNQGSQSPFSHFKENDAATSRIAPNVTDVTEKAEDKDDKKSATTPLTIAEKPSDVSNTEKIEQIVPTEMIKTVVTEASSASSPQLPTEMVKVLAVQANNATATAA